MGMVPWRCQLKQGPSIDTPRTSRPPARLLSPFTRSFGLCFAAGSGALFKRVDQADRTAVFLQQVANRFETQFLDALMARQGKHIEFVADLLVHFDHDGLATGCRCVAGGWLFRLSHGRNLSR